MKKMWVGSLFAALLAILFPLMGAAQTQQLTLKLSRDNGYGGFNNDIQGLFSMKVTGPSDLSSVDFYIDETKIGQVDQSPFNFQFTTDNYPLGNHQLSAMGVSSTGLEYRSNVITMNFVSKQAAGKMIFPILGVILLVILLSVILAFFGSGHKHKDLPLGVERNYGAGGGGICPNCYRPFALSFFSPHLGFSKLARCPYCGKVGLVRIASIAKLHQAEQAELTVLEPKGLPGNSEEETLRKEIDDSKYHDL